MSILNSLNVTKSSLEIESEQDKDEDGNTIAQKIQLDNLNIYKLLRDSECRYHYRELDSKLIEFERKYFEIEDDRLKFERLTICNIQYIPCIIQILADLYINNTKEK